MAEITGVTHLISRPANLSETQTKSPKLADLISELPLYSEMLAYASTEKKIPNTSNIIVFRNLDPNYSRENKSLRT